MLSKREKDKEEIELESCFSELREKAGMPDDELANKSLTDLKEMQDMQDLYRQPKPNDSASSFYKPRLASGKSSIRPKEE